ncbi:MAG: IS66 family transposase, partial [Candidatus Omnitrophica bacterium]|nr:IS66 family transposase [Candidatus Omnitrophota bacterium]
MFGFGKNRKDSDIRSLRREGLRIVRENHRLRRQNENLQKDMSAMHEEIRRLQFIIKEYQQILFKQKALKPLKKDDNRDDDDHLPMKKGAPIGHEGATRDIPKRVDEHKDVHIDKCPECSSNDISPCDKYYDHYQEDIIIPETKVTRFRHHYYWCKNCKKVIHGTGIGEIPASYIGPNVKSLAAFLHYQLSIPYNKIKTLFKEMFSMDFDPSSCVGFDTKIRIRGSLLYEKLKTNLKDRPYLNVDETGWRDKWLWCYADGRHAVYRIEPGRGQKELAGTLGDSYKGVLISDFLGAYNGIRSLKQKCLVHALRLIDKWRVYYGNGPDMVKYFTELKTAVKRIIRLNNQMKKKRLPNNFSIKKADTIGRLRRLLSNGLEPIKADKFRKKLLDHFDELVTCLNYKGIESHNNLVERCLRPNVIMRKITFGNRSEKGERNHEVIMSLIQTARLQGLNPLPFLRKLLTNPGKAASVISLDSSARYATPIEDNSALRPPSDPSSLMDRKQVRQSTRRLSEIALAPQC